MEQIFFIRDTHPLIIGETMSEIGRHLLSKLLAEMVDIDIVKI